MASRELRIAFFCKISTFCLFQESGKKLESISQKQVNDSFFLQSKQESTTWSEPASEQSGFVDASLEAPKSSREFSLSTSYFQLFSRKLRKVPS